MDRQERNRRDRNEPGLDYDRYEGYNRNDEHYHSARNLTNDFEQEYQRDRGHENMDRGRNSMNRSYHEGDMGDAYERRRGENSDYRGNARYGQQDWNRSQHFGDSTSRNRDRYSDDRDERQGNWDRYSSNRDRSQAYGNSQQRYSTDDRSGTSRSYDESRRRGEQDDYSGSQNNYGSPRYSDRNYRSGSGQEGSYGVRGGNRGDRDRDSGDNWRATHRLRSDF